MATCIRCQKERWKMTMGSDGICVDCHQEMVEERNARAERQERESGVKLDEALGRIIVTTETASNLPIATRLDIITAEVVIGMHLFRDIASAFRDTFGGRSETMQKGLRDARKTALEELRREALALGADAVVAVDLDYSEISGGGKSMLFLVASGTAVKLAPTGGAEDRA